MIAFCVPESFDVLAIPSGWDVFQYQGWLYRRHSTLRNGFSVETFYREKWIGQS